MILKALQRDDTGSSQWLDAVTYRIHSFSKRMNGNADVLVNTVWKLYAEKSPLLGLWVWITDDKRLIGHALAKVEEFDGRLVGWVTQVEMDEPATRNEKELGITTLENWVRNLNQLYQAQGIKVTELMMISKRMNDPWARHAGFELYRAIFRREVR